MGRALAPSESRTAGDHRERWARQGHRSRVGLSHPALSGHLSLGTYDWVTAVPEPRGVVAVSASPKLNDFQARRWRLHGPHAERRKRALGVRCPEGAGHSSPPASGDLGALAEGSALGSRPRGGVCKPDSYLNN